MPQYDPEAEAIGRYMAGFVEAAGEVSPVFERKAQEMFDKHLGRLEADEWYRLGDCAAAFEEILDQVGPNTMKRGGVAGAEALPLEADLSVAEALAGLNELQTGSVYRNSEMDAPAGRYIFEVNDDRTGRFAVSEAWPLTEPYAEGVYTGVVNEWGPEDAQPRLESVTPEGDEQFAWRAEW